MRILILSDLHHEVWRDAPPQAQQLLGALQPNLGVSQPDLVILAGDIDVGERAVSWADQTFPDLPVVYVHGNHEAYGQKIDTLKLKLAEACSATGHIHFLDKGELVIGNVRILGATLWTDFRLLGPDSVREAMQSAATSMNDYRKIRLARAGYRKIRPIDVLQWHSDERRWLESQLAKPFAGSTVVVTHMAPSARSVPDRYGGHSLSAAYASDLEALVSKADLWIHGHIHDSIDYQVGKARFVCNPLGYPSIDPDGSWCRENAVFDPNLVVETGMEDPAKVILLDAAALRLELSNEWLGAADVVVKMGAQSGRGSHYVSELRRNGHLLGVYVAHPVPGYRYPPWQFHADGRPIDQLAETLAVLRDFGPFERESDGMRRTTGWGELEWFLSAHRLLNDISPATMLTVDPDRVLHAARTEFGGDDP